MSEIISRIIALKMLTHDVSVTVSAYRYDDDTNWRYRFLIFQHDNHNELFPSDDGKALLDSTLGEGPGNMDLALRQFDACKDWPTARDWITAEIEINGEARLWARCER